MFAGSHLADRYELIERVAEGGMGEVWRARQLALEREVAIKVLHPLHRVSSPNLETRFQREAEIIGKISHRNVISIIDFGMTPKGDQFLVMPFLHGQTLEARMKSDPPPLDELLRIARDVLSGLAAIHDVGVVHRDLKPANIFLARDADGVVPKLLDFGISRDEKREGTMLTQDGTMMGTPHYMAPEQFESASTVDHRADLHGLGAILYEAIGGRTPYLGGDAFAVFRATLESDPPAIATLRKDMDAGLAALIDRAIAKSAEARFQSARDMRDAVDRVLQGKPLRGAAIPSKIADDISTAPTALAPDSLHSLDQIRVPPSRRGVWPWALGLGLAAAGVTAMVMLWPEPTPTSTPTRPVVVETDAPPTESDAPSFARVANSGSLRSLSIRFARLPPVEREHVVGFAPEGDRWSMLASPDHASAIVERLGTELEATRAEPTLRAKLMHTTVRLSVRERASVDSDLRRSVPHDTLVVALYGDVQSDSGDIESSTDVDGEMTYVVVSPASSGWSASRFLEEETGCLPLPAGLVREAPRSMAPAIRRTHTLARTHIRRGGNDETVFMAAGHTPTQTVVAFYKPDGRCGAGESIALVTQQGALDELFLTERNGDGESMLVLSTVDDATVRFWQLWPLETRPAESSWQIDLPTAANLVENESAAVFSSRDRLLRRHAQYTLAVRSPRARPTWYRWNGATLIESPPPGRAPTPHAPQLD